LKVVSAVLADDQAAIATGLRDRFQNHPERTDFYIDLIKKHVALGGKPAAGGGQQPDGSRREGWTGNPCYHAALMPVSIRSMEHFELKFPREAYNAAVLRFADFGLELLGGKPFDLEKFRTELEAEWPSRTVPTIPLMLHAYTLKPDKNYVRVAKMIFDDHLKLIERNPHGYFPAWSYTPGADKYDTVYNPVAYERGLTSFWSEHMLDVIGRDAATRFTAAQARWFIVSGQISDTFETDNVTAIRACTHGGHTGLRNQIGIYLHDDFAFYRGLVGELVHWAAATRPPVGRMPSAGTDPFRKLELSNAGSSMVRWALDIRPGSRRLESKIERLPSDGFRVKLWNRLPKARPTVIVRSDEIGRKETGEVLHVALMGPAYREPVEVEVKSGGAVQYFKVSRAVGLKFFPANLAADLPKDAKFELRRFGPDGEWKTLGDSLRSEGGAVEWQAEPGEYELRKR
jgi:hypothetical protein